MKSCICFISCEVYLLIGVPLGINLRINPFWFSLLPLSEEQ